MTAWVTNGRGGSKGLTSAINPTAYTDRRLAHVYFGPNVDKVRCGKIAFVFGN
jgi:hypothetical protein